MCSVDAPGLTAPNGYWIRERTTPPPPGYTVPTVLDIGIGSNTVPTDYTTIFSGDVPNDQTFIFPVASTGLQNLQARGPSWANIRDNPALPGDCGLNIALLIDTSGSITPFLPQVKEAANGFVDALTGTPSQIALMQFASLASAVLGPTPVSSSASADTVKAAINSLTSGGSTNWDLGLAVVAAQPTTFDAVLMLTDGNPTVYGPGPDGPGVATRFREVENGIFSANALKAKGTKVVAVGVGAGVAGAADNLKAISGPLAGSDFVQTDYGDIGCGVPRAGSGGVRGHGQHREARYPTPGHARRFRSHGRLDVRRHVDG